jgi:diaminohydroxyphosphoribosylaminopyrimidine deaminase / 5-amino-6-(5-phosphoribosylamino)uracil reductase
MVGTGTVEVDDPLLTVRDDWDRPVRHQPLRAVMGRREIAADRRILNNHAETLHLRTRDPAEALRHLFERDRQHVWLEGGPTLAAAFLSAGLVDEVVAYVAPSLLGAGASAVGDLGITTVADQLRMRIRQAAVIGTGADANVRLTLERTP